VAGLLKFLCRMGLHWFRVCADTGINEYAECRCGRRRVRCYHPTLVQPVSWDWLEGKTNALRVCDVRGRAGRVVYGGR
jgi:hypothetical protein